MIQPQHQPGSNHDKIDLSAEGFLCDYTEWTPEVGTWLSQQENIVLSQAHWEMISCIRAFYQQHQTIPNFRKTVMHIREILGPDKGKSLYLYELFPGNPLRRLCRIAGLPKPKHCT